MARTSRRPLIGASVVAIQPLLLNALSLPATAYIISSLGPAGYGEWSVALALIAATGVLANLGLRAAFVRNIARSPELSETAFGEQLGARIVMSIGAGALSVLACIALGYSSTVVICTAILAIGSGFGAVATVVADLLTGLERLPSMAAINAVAGLTLTAASVAVIWMGAGPQGLALAYLIGPVVSGVMALTLVQRRLFPVHITLNPRRSLALLGEAKALGTQLFVGNLGAQAENLLLPKLVDVASYGYFAAGTLLPSRLGAISDGLNTAFYPVLARSHAKGARALRSGALRFVALAGGACLLTAVPVFVLAGPIATVLFPSNPDLCRRVIQITIWSVPLVGVGTAISYSLNASFRERSETQVSLAGTLIGLVLSVALVARFGLLGACAAMVAKAVLGLGLRVHLFVGLLKTDPRQPANLAGSSALPHP